MVAPATDGVVEAGLSERGEQVWSVPVGTLELRPAVGDGVVSACSAPEPEEERGAACVVHEDDSAVGEEGPEFGQYDELEGIGGGEHDDWMGQMERSDRLGVVWGTEGKRPGYSMQIQDLYDECDQPVGQAAEADITWDPGFRSSLRSIPGVADWEHAKRGMPTPD